MANDQGGNRDMYYRALLDSLGYQYEYWNVQQSHGLDSTIVGYGNWNTAIIFGWGCGTLPGKDYTGDMWANFLDQGTADTSRNILYADQDYFCMHGDDDDYPDGCEFEGDLYAGEFLYDYFGVGWAKSDPVERDTVFISEAYPLLEFPLNTDNVRIPPWPDYTNATDNAVNMFKGKQSNQPCGTRYDGGTFKTVFLPLPFEALCDKDTATEEPILTYQALTVMDDILSWFGTKDSLEGVWEIPPGGELPQVFALSQNYPNPFNPTTRIDYSLPKECYVKFDIYNILGEKVVTLVDGFQKPGYKSILWGGKSESGTSVSSGIYFYRLKASEYSVSRKMIMLR